VQRNDFHEAMFPEELVRYCIKMYSFPGDIVLDPFMGSGTVAAVAKKLERHYIGYDLDPKCLKMSELSAAVITDAMIEKQESYSDKTENVELQNELSL
jgi:site-specific DNA-methyltransferase (adenine-specific)